MQEMGYEATYLLADVVQVLCDRVVSELLRNARDEL